MPENGEVVSIKVKISGKTIELKMADALKLKEALDGVFGEKIIIQKELYPQWYVTFPQYIQYKPWGTFSTSGHTLCLDVDNNQNHSDNIPFGAIMP